VEIFTIIKITIQGQYATPKAIIVLFSPKSATR